MEGKKKKNYNKYKPSRGSVAEGQGFADVKKRKMMFEYKKQQIKERKQQNIDKNTGKNNTIRKSGNSRNKPASKKLHRFEKDKDKHDIEKQEKHAKRKEIWKKKEATEKAMIVYNNKKKDTHKKLCKRTLKGQPVMATQMDVLLKKIAKLKDS